MTAKDVQNNSYLNSSQLATNTNQNLLFDTSVTPVQRVISSCVGGVVNALFVTPLDVIKTRLQTQEFMKTVNIYPTIGAKKVADSSKSAPTGTHSYHSVSAPALPANSQMTGSVGTFMKIARNEGLGSLWSGLSPTLLMTIPGSVIHFTVYDQIRIYLNQRFHLAEQPIWVPVVAGGAARVAACISVSPLEMVKTKMQSTPLSYTEIAQGLKQLVRTQGYSSLFRGLSPTLLRVVPFSCIYWSNYELLKKEFGSPIEPTFAVSFVCGATAGTIATVLTIPLDVVKTRRQMDWGEVANICSAQQKQSSNPSKTIDILIKIYRESGVKGLFVGSVPRIIREAPACAIMISCFECGKTFFREYNESKLL